MVAWRYRISLLVFNSISYSFAALTREISSNSISPRVHVLFSVFYLNLNFFALAMTFMFVIELKKITKQNTDRYGTILTHIHTYFIYFYTVKSSVYITTRSFITTALVYKIAVWEPDLYSWPTSLLKYPRESNFRKLMGKFFHNSARL